MIHEIIDYQSNFSVLNIESFNIYIFFMADEEKTHKTTHNNL